MTDPPLKYDFDHISLFSKITKKSLLNKGERNPFAIGVPSPVLPSIIPLTPVAGETFSKPAKSCVEQFFLKVAPRRYTLPMRVSN